MKVLLVALNAKYIHSNLAVYSLMSYADKYKDNISLLELTINHSEETILQEIYKEKADIIAFSCYIWNISMIKRISAELKKICPNILIWYGGPEVSYDAVQCLKELNFLDGIMIGEGEQTFLELLEHYEEGSRRLDEIEGLAYKDKGEVFITKDRNPISLDAIPFPYEDMEIFKNRIIYYESSRGCPFSCGYCLSSTTHGVRFRSLELVERELGVFLEYKVPQVKFVDRTFNCNKKHAMGIWRFIKDHDNGVTNFHFEISADLLDDEEVAFLATLRPGQVQFEIGVQTTNPDTALAIQRRADFQKLSHRVRQIKEGNNIHHHLDLIAGLPLEDYASFEKSFMDVYLLKPDQLQLGFLKVLKGSAMETVRDQYGIIHRDTPPYEVLSTKALSFHELLKLKGVCEMVEVYYNSGQFKYSIRYLEHFYLSSPMKLYQALADYYEACGYNLISHSRMRRYEILLEFYEKVILKDMIPEERDSRRAVFGEIMVFDVFLREDMKSRPVFASQNLKNQSNLRELYDKYQGKKRRIHIEPFVYDVVNSANTGEVINRPITVLFDYDHRDPLDKGAQITILES